MKPLHILIENTYNYVLCMDMKIISHKSKQRIETPSILTSHKLRYAAQVHGGLLCGRPDEPACDPDEDLAPWKNPYTGENDPINYIDFMQVTTDILSCVAPPYNRYLPSWSFQPKFSLTPLVNYTSSMGVL